METTDVVDTSVTSVSAGEQESDLQPLKRQRGRPPCAVHLKGSRGTKRIRKSANSGEGSGSSKAKPLTTYEIVAAILGKISTRDPMTVSELCSNISNASRENVHIVVDILTILGILMQVRLKEPPKPVNSTNSGRGGYHASRVHYALNGYLRSPTPIENVTDLTDFVEEKLKSIEAITKRNKELQVRVLIDINPLLLGCLFADFCCLYE
jgi:hypothetical protein